MSFRDSSQYIHFLDRRQRKNFDVSVMIWEGALKSDDLSFDWSRSYTWSKPIEGPLAAAGHFQEWIDRMPEGSSIRAAAMYDRAGALTIAAMDARQLQADGWQKMFIDATEAMAAAAADPHMSANHRIDLWQDLVVGYREIGRPDAADAIIKQSAEFTDKLGLGELVASTEASDSPEIQLALKKVEISTAAFNSLRLLKRWAAEPPEPSPPQPAGWINLLTTKDLITKENLVIGYTVVNNDFYSCWLGGMSVNAPEFEVINDGLYGRQNVAVAQTLQLEGALNARDTLLENVKDNPELLQHLSSLMQDLDAADPAPFSVTWLAEGLPKYVPDHVRVWGPYPSDFLTSPRFADPELRPCLGSAIDVVIAHIAPLFPGAEEAMVADYNQAQQERAAFIAAHPEVTEVVQVLNDAQAEALAAAAQAEELATAQAVGGSSTKSIAAPTQTVVDAAAVVGSSAETQAPSTPAQSPTTDTPSPSGVHLN